jgi:outer membrane protein
LSVSLFEFGAISNRIKQAEARVQSSAYDLERTRQDIVYQMAIAYLQTQLASDQLTIRAGALETERAINASIEQAVSIGTRPPTDALQQQANVARAELSVIEQEQVLTRQLNVLRRLTNIQDLERASLLPIDLDPLLTRRVPEVEQLMGLASMKRPERASIEAQQEAASFGLKIAESGRLPSLSASTSYGTSFSSSALSPSINPSTGEMSFEPIPFGNQLSDNRSQSVGLRLSIPIFNRGTVQSAVQQSIIGLEALALQEQDWMDRQQADLAEAKLAFDSGVNRIRASRAQLEAAQASLAAILASYEQGVASLIDLTQAQFGRVQAEGELLFAKYQAVVSLVDLSRLTGTISPDAPFFMTN